MPHVWLVGMMGAGKTTVGALVAERMSLPLVDSDGLVMERTGRTIPELFEEGEDRFREAERAALAEIASGPDGVVSTGGGVVLDETNVELMRSTGTIVLLEAEVEELVARISGVDDRPLATDGAAIEEIAAARARRYRNAADHTVDTSGRRPEQVAEDVMRWLNT